MTAKNDCSFLSLPPLRIQCNGWRELWKKLGTSGSTVFLILFTLPQHGPSPRGLCSSACSSFSAPPLQTDFNTHTHTHTIHSPAYQLEHRWRPYSLPAHTHPSHSQTSRLLFTSLSLGTPFQGTLSTFTRWFDYQNQAFLGLFLEVSPIAKIKARSQVQVCDLALIFAIRKSRQGRITCDLPLYDRYTDHILWFNWLRQDFISLKTSSSDIRTADTTFMRCAQAELCHKP